MQSEEPQVSTEVELSAHKQAEADFFDQTANVRTRFGNIPAESDIRRATRSIPRIPGQPHFDPKMDQILEGDDRDRFIASVAHRPAAGCWMYAVGPAG